MRDPGFPGAAELRRAAWDRLWTRLLQPPNVIVEPSSAGDGLEADQGSMEHADAEPDASVAAPPDEERRTKRETRHQDAA